MITGVSRDAHAQCGVHTLCVSELTLFRASKCATQVAQGEALINEGEEGDSMYILESGEMEVRIKTEGLVRTYVKSDFFGELGASVC